jgi:tRNA(adenine34) deaminase
MNEETKPQELWMRLALKQAVIAASRGETPVGAVIARDGKLIGQAHNQVELLKDPTAHAEMIVITQAASAVGDWRLTDCHLYVTKEPCPMCAGAIVQARIPLVVWGMTDPRRGGCVSLFKILQSDKLNHRADYLAGMLEDECKGLMQEFFRKRRSS